VEIIQEVSGKRIRYGVVSPGLIARNFLESSGTGMHLE